MTVTPAPAQAVENATWALLHAEQTFYTYVEAGQSFNALFRYRGEVSSGEGVTAIITMVRPDGTTSACTNIKYPSPYWTTTCAFNEVAPVTGVYALNYHSEADFPRTVPLVDWNISVTNGALGAAGTTVATGRTWSEKYGVRNHYAEEYHVKTIPMWVQTQDGYSYRMTINNLHGIDSQFTSNAFGVIDTNTCKSVRHSGASGTVNSHPEIQDVAQQTACDYSPYKIFFEPPSNALPRSVTLPTPVGTTDTRLPQGGTTWLKTPIIQPKIESLSYAISDEATSLAGSLSFSIPGFEGTAYVNFDTDNDGVYDGPLDRTEQVTVINGQPVTLPFDGRDAAGGLLGPKDRMKVQVQLKEIGEAHFILGDVEAVGGLEVVRANGPLAGKPAALHWDDTPLDDRAYDFQAGIKCSATPLKKSPVEGIVSTGGVHGWDYGSCFGMGERPDENNSINSNPNNAVFGGGWGNNRDIDNWVFTDVALDVEVFVPPEPAKADVWILKDDHKSEVKAGEKLTYDLTVGNDSATQAVTDAVVTDELPENVTYVSASNGGALSTDGKRVTWNLGDLAPGATTTVQVTVEVKSDAKPGDDVINTATIETPGGCVREDACETTDRDVLPKLAIAKTDNQKTTMPGEKLTYDVTVTNQTDVDAEKVVVTDKLPANVEYLSSSDNGNYDLATHSVVWSLDKIAGNAVKTVKVAVKVKADASKQIVNTATVKSPTACTSQGECDATDKTVIDSTTDPSPTEPPRPSTSVPTEPSPKAPLATTGGAEYAPVAGVAVLLLAVGAGLVVARLRKRAA